MGPLEVLRDILKLHPRIAAISTRCVRPAPQLQQRSILFPTAEIVRRAQSLQTCAGVPFMDGFNLALIEAGISDEDVVKKILFQNRNEVISWTSAATVMADGFQDRPESATDFHVVSSEVRLNDGSSGHLAMLDFHVPASPSALAQAVQIGRAIGSAGWILESGHSYHYYGKSLLAPRELVEFLGRALMFAPITDRGWIAHQLVAGACSLRTGAHPSKVGVPVVVEEFG